MATQKINYSQTDLAARTWHNELSNRAVETTYTNNYSYPIEVAISMDMVSGTAARLARLYVDGVEVATFYMQSTTATTRTIIPAVVTVNPGSTYEVTGISGGAVIYRWAELY